MACVQPTEKNPNGKPARNTKWKCIVRIAGHKPVTKICTKQKDAEEWGMKKEIEIRSSKPSKVNIDGPLLFTDVLDEYLQHARLKGLKTEKAHERLLEYWRDEIGYLEISSIDTRLVTEKKLKLANSVSHAKGANRTKLGGATINRKIQVLGGFFNWAIKERQLLEVNPVLNARKMPEPKGRVRFLSTEERERLFAACKASSNSALYTRAVISCYTGMRREELLSLQWDDCDLQNGWATLKDTKNGTDRKVPVKGPALTVLREWRNRDRFATGYIFSNGRSTKKPQHAPQAWYKALETANVQDFHWHDWRHCCASYLVQSGAELLDVATILGHSSLDMVMRYAHLSPKRVADVSSRMCEQFG
jgi:integrase